MKYDIDYFIKKFDAIPDSKWGCGAFSSNGRRCALGHCGVGKSVRYTAESLVLSRLFLQIESNPADINDGTMDCWRDLGHTPKKRILNALYLAKAIQQYGF